MAIVDTPALPPIGPAPTTSDPDNFDSRADTFLGLLPAWGDAVTATGDAVKNNANEAKAQAITSGQQAVIAAQQANQAALAVAAAQAAAGVLPWVSGQYYAAYAPAIDPGNLQTYRRRTAGSGTVAPADDPTNWAPLLTIQAMPVVPIGVDTVALAGNNYMFTASCRLTLPASPMVGDLVAFNNESGTKTCTIDPGSNKIRGVSGVMRLNNRTAAATLKYSGVDKGWIQA